MIDILLIIVACGLLVSAIWLAATLLDYRRKKQAQSEIVRSDAWERQMMEGRDDFPR